jgi:hypothetical protein
MSSNIDSQIEELKRRYGVVPGERSPPEYFAALKRLMDELTSSDDAPQTPQARLADLLNPPAERLVRVHERDVRKRFREWMRTATVHQLSEVLLTIARGEMDEEMWLREHLPAPDGAGSQSKETNEQAHPD